VSGRPLLSGTPPTPPFSQRLVYGELLQLTDPVLNSPMTSRADLRTGRTGKVLYYDRRGGAVSGRLRSDAGDE
jgi:hypothetical protein